MAEQNPLGGSGGGTKSPKSGGGPPWAYLVQDAEKGTRQQLRVDGDAVQLFDKKGKPVASYSWTSIKRWTAEQNNVFLFSARVDEKMVDLRLHCDDAFAIANACNKGVKLAVAKHKERQQGGKTKQLATVVEEEGSGAEEEEEEEKETSSSDDEEEEGNTASARASASKVTQSPQPKVIRPKVKLLYGRSEKASTNAAASASTSSSSKPVAESSSSTSNNQLGSSQTSSEIWSGYLREKAGSRFSITSGKKKYWVLKSNQKLRAYQVDPVSGNRKLQRIYTIVNCPSRGQAKNTKYVSVEVVDGSSVSKPSQGAKQLQLEAETLDAAVKLSSAIAHCLSAADAPAATTTPPAVAPSPKKKISEEKDNHHNDSHQPLSPQPPAQPSPRRLDALEEQKTKKEQIESDENENENETLAAAGDRVVAFTSPSENCHQASVKSSNSSSSRQRGNSLLGPPGSLFGSLTDDTAVDVDDVTPSPSRRFGHQTTPVKTLEEEIEAAREAEEEYRNDEDVEDDDSPIGKEIPDAKASPQAVTLQVNRLENSHDLSQMLLGQLVKKVDAMELDMREQKEQIRSVAAKQREQMNTPPPPPPKPTVVVDNSMETLQQWGEIELLTTRMDRMEFQFDDLKQSFNAIVNDLSQNLVAIRDILLVSGNNNTNTAETHTKKEATNEEEK